jgi:hypothetical protein
VKSLSFADMAIVSCGTLSLELKRLSAEGFLDTEHLFFTTPGLHEDIHELERQLLDRIAKAGHSGGAVVLDGIGYLDTYMAERPEDFLDYSDWMGIPIIPYPVTLDRFKMLLADA